jgi:hypothetical protein
MVLLSGSILAGATVALIVALVVIGAEQKKGARLFLTTVRGWIDQRLEGFARWVRQALHIVAISAMYLVHQVRAGLARAIAPQPRRRQKPPERLQFEHTDNHLSSMHDHKSDTALSNAQKKKLRHQKLEERL